MVIKCCFNVGQRRKRWTNTKPALGQRLLFGNQCVPFNIHHMTAVRLRVRRCTVALALKWLHDGFDFFVLGQIGVWHFHLVPGNLVNSLKTAVFAARLFAPPWWRAMLLSCLVGHLYMFTLYLPTWSYMSKMTCVDHKIKDCGFEFSRSRHCYVIGVNINNLSVHLKIIIA